MTTDLTQRLAARAATPAQRGDTIAELIERQKDQIALALPRHIGADRFARIVLTTLRQNPKLGACKPVSLLGALMQAAQLGLEPGPLGGVYLVPFGDEVTLIIGYRGLIDLARRSGQITSIDAHVVYEADDFDFAYGLTPTLYHRPVLNTDRGDPIGAYAVAVFKDGGHSFVVLGMEDIDARRSKSRAGRTPSSPWVTDWAAMARKSAIRALATFLPLNPEFSHAVEADEQTYEWRGAPVVTTPLESVDGGGAAGTGTETSHAGGSEPEPAPGVPLPSPSTYDTWSGAELAEECRSRSLLVSGTKAQLIERLIADDEEAEARQAQADADGYDPDDPEQRPFE